MCSRVCVPLITWHCTRTTSEFHACMFYRIRYGILHTHTAKIQRIYATPFQRLMRRRNIRASVSIELIGGLGLGGLAIGGQ